MSNPMSNRYAIASTRRHCAASTYTADTGIFRKFARAAIAARRSVRVSTFCAIQLAQIGLTMVVTDARFA